ncbi:MAG: 3-deoxy-7-phosphoheptulonate synthase [Myxococcota bacterium]
MGQTPSLANTNILSQDLLPTPEALAERYPLSQTAATTVEQTRAAIRNILARRDPRALVVVGPCSIHDVKAAKEYASRLRELAEEMADTLLIVMRVYFEKPRTSVGWKGLINDPRLNDTFHIEEGLATARELLVHLGGIGMGVATEALDPITPQYLGDLIGWAAIGARTSESQTHRDMASGLSSPVGIKNGTDGKFDAAVNALEAVSRPQHFLGVTAEVQCAVFRTRGNDAAHLILRGGGGRPNYDSVSVSLAEEGLAAAGLSPNIVVDCSHGNSFKRHEMQPRVIDNCVNQIREGNRSIIGFMLESHLREGRQDLGRDLSQLRYGVSVTDACMGWETTVATLGRVRDRVGDALRARLEPAA